jgi:hypothetical protein
MNFIEFLIFNLTWGFMNCQTIFYQRIAGYGLKSSYQGSPLLGANFLIVGNYGQCLRKCTENESCQTGQYFKDTKQCQIYNKFSSTNDLEMGNSIDNNIIVFNKEGYYFVVIFLLNQINRLKILLFSKLGDNQVVCSGRALSKFGGNNREIFNLQNGANTYQLNNKGIECIFPDIFQDIVSLSKIDLSHNLISSLTGKQFKGLTSLKELFLDNNKLSSLPKDLLKGLNSLKFVNLSDNMLHSIDKSFFIGLNSINKINMENNSFTQNLPSQLFSSLSNCAVSVDSGIGDGGCSAQCSISYH